MVASAKLVFKAKNCRGGRNQWKFGKAKHTQQRVGLVGEAVKDTHYLCKRKIVNGGTTHPFRVISKPYERQGAISELIKSLRNAMARTWAQQERKHRNDTRFSFYCRGTHKMQSRPALLTSSVCSWFPLTQLVSHEWRNVVIAGYQYGTRVDPCLLLRL
jgi:hypothetical protein